MYGIVNKGVQSLVTDNWGDEMWSNILEDSKIEVDLFLSNEIYDDEITYKLAISASKLLDVSVGDVLYEFGKHWVLKTSIKHYGKLMESGGANLKDFLINLPNFHSRVMLIFPKITPPEFKVTQIEENSLHLHYFSKREGLKEFVRGIVKGLGTMFETPVEIELVEDRDAGDDHEVFKITW
ncbi:MAG: heme NO-binding domain-containing protein [Flavobacteriales bacterium]|nr:heme NO-binding domain-containing protein [Flavobacteriales bacterium]